MILKPVLIFYATITLVSLCFCGSQPAKSARVGNEDTLCLADRTRAKQDVKLGNIYFCQPMGMVSGMLRNEKYLEKLCGENRLKFRYELFSDVIIEGQTQGCYMNYMDSVIAKKFGTDFKKELLRKADSMLVASGDTVEYFLCDYQPHPFDNPDPEPYYSISTAGKLDGQLIVDGKDSPFMEIVFCVNKEGKAAGYREQYAHGLKGENERLESQLFSLAVAELKKHDQWRTGTILEQSVPTYCAARVFFN